jgi:hypothetical protein
VKIGRAHDQARTALRQWAKDNSIDTIYLMFGSMRGDTRD